MVMVSISEVRSNVIFIVEAVSERPFLSFSLRIFILTLSMVCISGLSTVVNGLLAVSIMADGVVLGI